LPLEAIIIGAGFAGAGMAISLKRAGIEDFVLLERAPESGGVWRDNTYPGAACDVPSHLYSFSFEPNPDWTRMFAPQAEINAYLTHCVTKYGILPHIRFNSEVAEASWDEPNRLWRVTLANGDMLESRLLMSATGQLSRPLMPSVLGLDQVAIPAFHSARWDHSVAVDDRDVAVIGTGASAIQFVPAIAARVRSLKLFQRSAAYVIPRPDRAYTDAERARFRKWPLLMKLHRLAIYVSYEFRALAFTRFSALLDLLIAKPFRQTLASEIADPVLRAKLMPNYPAGCKRILLSSEYWSTLARPNVELVTTPIRELTPAGVRTEDGTHYDADVLIYGTGFAATEFLSPMRIAGRAGLALNDAWRDGASAYFGLAVPDFPNFFILYGPNTNLGHNSIIYMLEAQIAHVMRCIAWMRRCGADTVEIGRHAHSKQDLHVQRRLAATVWAGCKSWYLDAAGRNTTNWPGFTFTYRLLARHSGLGAYRFTRRTEHPDSVVVKPPPGLLERAYAAFLRGFLRVAFRPIAGPPFGAVTQRRVVAALSAFMAGGGGARRETRVEGGVATEIVTPREGAGRLGVLYLHGGAFCLGSPYTHRAITTRLAAASGRAVWVPDYRLAPEHPYPAALDDALACWRAMRAAGFAPEQIDLFGDSAGGALALALALRLRDSGEAMPARLCLLSPVTDISTPAAGVDVRSGADVMIRRDWLVQALGWYGCPPGTVEHVPLVQNLSGLPPIFIQVGSQEILLADSTRLADHARACGVDCRLEIYESRWHVFQLQAFTLQSARSAIEALS
jgi:cation diffusion facilitator CzcD-associated flavoprotein CzcO/acetyl esterase/lipase